MLELIPFPDAEAWATAYVRTELAARPESYATGVYVATKTPNPRRDRMVILRRDGGPRQSLVTERARLGIQVWAAPERDEDAADLTNLVRAILNASPGTGPVRRVDEISGPSYVTDEAGQPFRYLVLEFVMRASRVLA